MCGVASVLAALKPMCKICGLENPVKFAADNPDPTVFRDVLEA